MAIKIVDKYKNEEYIGNNRCEACSFLNVAIAVMGGTLIARRSRVGGALIFVASLGIIYLRGYLIPGTPTLTKRYLPTSVLSWFGKEPDTVSTKSGLGSSGKPSIDSESDASQSKSRETITDTSQETDTTATILSEQNPEEYFLQLEVLEVCKGGYDLCLTSIFEADWSNAMTTQIEEGLSTDRTTEIFGLGENEYTLEEHNKAWSLYNGRTVVGRWPSRTALVADLAATTILRKRDPQWADHSYQEKGQLLTSLRLFLNECPDGGGSVQVKEQTIESCCQSRNVLVAICADNDDMLFEHSIDDLAQ